MILSDPKVVEYAALTQRYKSDAQNLSNLSTSLSTASQQSFVNLFDVLHAHKIGDKSRVIEGASAQITKAVKSFVGKSIYDELHKGASRRVSSTKNVQHMIVGCKFQQDVSAYIARATIETATRGTDPETRRHIKEALLAQLFVVWSATCVPLIEAEKASLQEDAARCKSLLTVLKRTLKAACAATATPQTKTAAYEAFFKSVYMSHMHTVERVRRDPWFTSQALLWNPQAVDTSSSADAFLAWCATHGERFKAAFGQDVARLSQLAKERADSQAWRATETVHSIDDPLSAFCFLPPGYIGRFETPTSRVYGRYTKRTATPQSATRALVLVQTVWVLHDIIQKEWLPIRYVSTDYALALVDTERSLYSHKVRAIVNQLIGVCRDAGYMIGEEQIDRVVYDVCAQQAHCATDDDDERTATASSSSSSLPASACVDSCAPTHSAYSIHAQPEPVPLPTAAHVDTLCTSRAKSAQFLPHCVHWHALVDYVVVHVLSELVSCAIDRGRGSGIVSTLEIRTDDLTLSVDQELRAAIHEMPCSELRDALLPLARPESLRQSIPAVVKALLAAGQKGWAAFDRLGSANGSHGVLWTVMYEPDRAKSGMLLTIGYGTHDPMLFLVFNLCSRIKGWMDQSWPLPAGVEWAVKRPRIATMGGQGGGASKPSRAQPAANAAAASPRGKS